MDLFVVGHHATHLGGLLAKLHNRHAAQLGVQVHLATSPRCHSN
eukprot:CAMPEP_0203940452 /NCGR_PEP_ID=MMETSP0359-20131031/77034_1 /ASSEMBLY_ACC=CAM_ASM_000338 /TAXON_ID=268821 /ORGANISM="Scrippsiella Hangoei, Strain SHTV-5" /LENGTH=43 /DNA_ID= /DNA_START= /DNA_END= /DNA_ORIENTATION=